MCTGDSSLVIVCIETTQLGSGDDRLRLIQNQSGILQDYS